jgi:predicted DNA-binding transcriptional regulator AlpA
MTQTSDSTKLVGLTEAADLTGLDKKVLVRKINTGELPYVQKLPGRTGAYLLPRSAVIELARSLADGADDRARRIRAAIAEERAS